MHSRDVMRIAAFIPTYQEGLGQGVQVIYRDGTCEYKRVSMRSFVHQLSKAFAVNVQEIRRQFGPFIGKKNLVPLVLSPFLLYAPLKTRKPLVAGDPTYGYFRLRSIMEASDTPQPCTLLLEGDTKMTITQSYRAVCSHLRAARKLEAHLLELFCDQMDDGMTKLYLHTSVKAALTNSKNSAGTTET